MSLEEMQIRVAKLQKERCWLKSIWFYSDMGLPTTHLHNYSICFDDMSIGNDFEGKLE